jgi:hypothetical protein
LRIINSGMAESALNTDRLKGSGGIEKPGEADDGIQLEKRKGDSRIIQINRRHSGFD